jgi:hypothetical protein
MPKSQQVGEPQTFVIENSDGSELWIDSANYADILDPRGFGTQIDHCDEHAFHLFLGSADAIFTFDGRAWVVDIVGDFESDLSHQLVEMIAQQIATATGKNIEWSVRA